LTAVDAPPQSPGREAEPLVLVERDGLVGTVTLNRPKQLNALSDELMRATVAALVELDGDHDIRAIVLTGSERAFAAGADIKQMASSTAMDVILTGRTLSAREAEQAGLVSRVVTREMVVREAQSAAEAIARKAPIAQRLAREAIDKAADMGLADGLAFERKSLYLAFASDDAREGLTAFTEHRRP
jgi:enoyl-CoA hydratase/carnithine racemase